MRRALLIGLDGSVLVTPDYADRGGIISLPVIRKVSLAPPYTPLDAELKQRTFHWVGRSTLYNIYEEEQ